MKLFEMSSFYTAFPGDDEVLIQYGLEYYVIDAPENCSEDVDKTIHDLTCEIEHVLNASSAAVLNICRLVGARLMQQFVQIRLNILEHAQPSFGVRARWSAAIADRQVERPLRTCEMCAVLFVMVLVKRVMDGIN